MKKMKKKGGGVLLRISNSRSGTFQAWTERSPYTDGSGDEEGQHGEPMHGWQMDAKEREKSLQNITVL